MCKLNLQVVEDNMQPHTSSKKFGEEPFNVSERPSPMYFPEEQVPLQMDTLKRFQRPKLQRQFGRIDSPKWEVDSGESL
ncbi:hypothetical protein OS493_002532 [Desmophyllum pertusum]|uniref:Uncharacterized protein n=1 Tax=Desmophyllum pertusum TaxID=174260 RepID=A0A9W9YTD1_9CNID|nr:hypothetical protein OS493_002532 [Desmophyllum pertusum]